MRILTLNYEAFKTGTNVYWRMMRDELWAHLGGLYEALSGI